MAKKKAPKQAHLNNVNKKSPTFKGLLRMNFVIFFIIMECIALKFFTGNQSHSMNTFLNVLNIGIIVSALVVNTNRFGSFTRIVCLKIIIPLTNRISFGLTRRVRSFIGVEKDKSPISLSLCPLVQSRWTSKSRNIDTNRFHPVDRLYYCQYCSVKTLSPEAEYDLLFKAGMLLPPRTRHCKFCDECSISYDHHCFFVDACISEKNHVAFYCFLFWSNFGLAYQKIMELILLSIYIGKRLNIPECEMLVQYYEWFFNTSMPVDNIYPILIILDFLVGSVVLGLMMYLLMQQIYMLFNNLVSNEKMKYRSFGCSDYPYDFKKAENTGALMGFWLNIRFRVWSGLLEWNDCSSSFYTSKFLDDSSLDLSPHMSDAILKQQISSFANPGATITDKLKEFAHTLACYLVPCWWRFSGEQKIHSDVNVATKNLFLPREALWESSIENYGNSAR